MRTDYREERALKLERREKIRPLRAMLYGTAFGVTLPFIKTHQVRIRFMSWSRAIDWDDAGNKRLVGELQRELLHHASGFVDESWADLVS